MPSAPVTPASLIPELKDGLAFLDEVIEARDGDLGRLGKSCEELCTHYRALGICHLSGEGDTDASFTTSSSRR